MRIKICRKEAKESRYWLRLLDISRNSEYEEERKGTKNCHREHKVGDSYDFDTERGKLCPLVMHVLLPAIDILRYGGSLPGSGCSHKGLFACPDPDVLLVFEIEKISDKESELKWAKVTKVKK